MTDFVVTGAGGLLGQAFVSALSAADTTRFSRGLLDSDHPDEVINNIVSAQPRYIINCAAHTDLEAAEQDTLLNDKVNRRLPTIIAEAAVRSGALLLHFSSTGCYGNWKNEPYNENDVLRPTTAHHRAKADGETAVRNSGCRHLIVRTGWLYGGAPGQPKNFVWRRLVEARENTQMTSDAGQRGCPTYVGDVVHQTLELARAGLVGTFNVTAHGSASRYEYVREIIETAGIPCRVEPGPPFMRLAKVSPNEMAINARMSSLGVDAMPAWQAPLQAYVRSLLQSEAWMSLK